eukprot:gene13934-9961_t
MSGGSVTGIHFERLLEQHRQAYRLPALAALAWCQGKTLIDVSVGQRSLEDASTPTPSDRWHLGSITKPMTATLVGRLVDRGLLTFDMQLGSLSDDAFSLATMHPGYRSVTIRQLLQHRGGLLEDIGQLPSWNESLLTDPRPLPEQRRLLAKEALSIPPLASPGSRCVYSNAGYLVVGTILETLTGETWEDLLRREVFAPLQMSSAGFGAPRAISPAQPQGHRMADDDGGSEEPGSVWVVDDIDNPPVMGPAGTVHATLADLARFATVHLPPTSTSSITTGDDYLRATTLQELHRSAIDEVDGEEDNEGTAASSCMGWFRVSRGWAQGTALCHSGSNGRWEASVWIAPARALILVAATNAGGTPASGEAIEATLSSLIDATTTPKTV